MLQRFRSALGVRTRIRRLRRLVPEYRVERRSFGPRTAWRHVRWFHGPESVHRVTARGVSVLCRFGPDQIDLHVWREVFEFGEYGCVDVEDAAWILDIGGNVGFSALWFAQRYPEARIVVVEPDHGNYEMLLANVGGEPRIHPIRAAIAPAGAPRQRVVTGVVRFGGATLETMPVDEEIDGVDGAIDDDSVVDSIDVATILDRFGIDRLDLMKIDVEGAELAVFEDSAAWIDRVDAIVAELHEYQSPGVGEVFRAMTSTFADTATAGADPIVTEVRPPNGAFASVVYARRPVSGRHG